MTTSSKTEIEKPCHCFWGHPSQRISFSHRGCQGLNWGRNVSIGNSGYLSIWKVCHLKFEDVWNALKFRGDAFSSAVVNGASVWVICSLFAVHGRSNVWRGESHVHGLPESKETEDRHLSPGQRRRVSRQPTSPVGTGHRHPESLAAGPHTWMETSQRTRTHSLMRVDARSFLTGTLANSSWVGAGWTN